MERQLHDVSIGQLCNSRLFVFRTASMLLFDPSLVLLGPSAFVILDTFGKTGYLAWCVGYTTFLGGLGAAVGYWKFRRGDLI